MTDETENGNESEIDSEVCSIPGYDDESEPNKMKLEYYEKAGLVAKSHITAEELTVLIMPDFDIEFDAMRYDGEMQLGVATHPNLTEVKRAMACGELDSEDIDGKRFLRKDHALAWAIKSGFDMPDALRNMPTSGGQAEQSTAEVSDSDEPESENSIIDRVSGYDISFQGQTVHLRKCRGIKYLIELIRRPDEPIDALQLETADRVPNGTVRISGIRDYTPRSEDAPAYGAGFGPSDADMPHAEPEALRRILRQMQQYRAEAEEEREGGNLAAARELDEQADALEREYLRPSVLPGGASQVTRGELSRAADRVYHNIRRGVLNRLELGDSRHPELHAHFQASLSYGPQPCYRPDPPVDWCFL